MAVLLDSRAPAGMRSLSGALDVHSQAETVFGLICSIPKWPVWLAFLRSARLADPKSKLEPGSEVIVHSAIPGDSEQVYEVDQYVENYRLSLVGAFSIRRRIDFRVERKTTRSKVHVRVDYPAYGGRIGALYDQLTSGRKLSAALNNSLVHFKGLVEYDSHPDSVLADF
ncbi:MAG: hypothetical protein M3Y21_04555 [Candidatus Eremiobacteraeota bacterium]|nr:hypothetical protein [Candidatus Eremiobacteraeota bacterium]